MTFEPPSLWALLRTVGIASPLGRNVWSLLVRGRGNDGCLVAAERPDYSRAITRFVMDRDDQARRTLSLLALLDLYFQDLSDFVCRYFLLDKLTPDRIAFAAVRESFEKWNMLGSRSFEADLLCRVRDQVSSLKLQEPTSMPAVNPPWLINSTKEEKHFLSSTLTLDFLERKILLQTVYAGMTPREIAPALLTGGVPWPPKLVEVILREAWTQAFLQL